ncbi:hypothetical protein MRX96_005410 [Rhipicephalus microplus]
MRALRSIGENYPNCTAQRRAPRKKQEKRGRSPSTIRKRRRGACARRGAGSGPVSETPARPALGRPARSHRQRQAHSNRPRKLPLLISHASHAALGTDARRRARTTRTVRFRRVSQASS